jgi:3-methylcrotonyl-CoA carboxylase alpha subunit
LRIGEREVRVEVQRRETGRYRVQLDDGVRDCAAQPSSEGRLRIESDGTVRDVVLTRGQRVVFVSSPERDLAVRIESARRAGGHEAHGAGEVSLPMPGRVVKVHVQEGVTVTKGQPLLVVEAMKMEHTLKAARHGVVAKLAAREGEMVDAGVILLELHDETST